MPSRVLERFRDWWRRTRQTRVNTIYLALILAAIVVPTLWVLFLGIRNQWPIVTVLGAIIAGVGGSISDFLGSPEGVSPSGRFLL